MIDINSALMQAYYEAISALDIPIYEGEEPDNLTDKLYAVFGDISTNETSTKNSPDINVIIQLAVHSWDFKYNNTKLLNTKVNDIINAIKSGQNNVLDLSQYGLQMLNLTVNTQTQNYGNLNGRVYISRILTFKQDIFVL